MKTIGRPIELGRRLGAEPRENQERPLGALGKKHRRMFAHDAWLEARRQLKAALREAVAD
jgi:hypothetical protein